MYSNKTHTTILLVNPKLKYHEQIKINFYGGLITTITKTITIKIKITSLRHIINKY